MNEKEAYIHQWIDEVTKENEKLEGFYVCPYASKSKTKIVENPIDDIVAEPGYDVIIFIVEDFWQSYQVRRWVDFYNEKFPYYVFFEDFAYIQSLNKKYNLILCQSKIKLSKVRKKLNKVDSYSYWREDYIKEVLGDEYVDIEETTE